MRLKALDIVLTLVLGFAIGAFFGSLYLASKKPKEVFIVVHVEETEA